MIADLTLATPVRARSTETFVAAYVALAIAVGLVLTGQPAPSATLASALMSTAPACAMAGDRPEQVVYRYFELGAGSHAAECWSAGRGPKSLAERPSHAHRARPLGFAVHAERTGSDGTTQFASLLVSARWDPEAPALWAADSTRWISLAQQADGRWTIESVGDEPLVRARQGP